MKLSEKLNNAKDDKKHFRNEVNLKSQMSREIKLSPLMQASIFNVYLWILNKKMN